MENAGNFVESTVFMAPLRPDFEKAFHAFSTSDRRARCRGEQPLVSASPRLRECHGGPEYERLITAEEL